MTTPQRKYSSRREFLGMSTAGIAAGSLAANLSIARSAHAAGDETVKIAFIGCGGRGTGACKQSLCTKSGPVKLVPEKLALDATPPTTSNADGYYPVAMPGVTKAF
ncbi:MAG: twin-arginine translocation signal domain-containing protein [Pirellulales bacterium]|nr:twin-arginine translocation signal domain-containing protein [Pirellulales bacterium]